MNLEERKVAITLRNAYEEKAKELKNLNDLTEEWFNKVDDNRRLFYKAIKHERAFLKSLTKEQVEKFNSERGFKENNFSNSNYNFHPHVTDYNRKNYIEVLTSMSGKTVQEIIELIKNKIAVGATETEAYRELFNELPLRTDKYFIALDLETASPSPVDLRGKFDFGTRTEIIEIGYVKLSLDPESNFEPIHYSKLFGVHKDLLETNGTGLVEVHNITTDMVKDKGRFIENTKEQLDLYNILKNSVLVAHNARFEKGQLSHHLRGFNKLMKSGNLEILDTMHISKFYMPENENNTNECFVKTTGGNYENAHRAYDDAVMTFNALMRLKGLPEVQMKKLEEGDLK